MFKRAEREFSAYNFEFADTARLVTHFADAEKECRALVDRGLALPAYDQCLKASHLFNLLDARGAISVTERAAYILRVRALAKACCEDLAHRTPPERALTLSRSMGELLLELLCEEIPARMQAPGHRGSLWHHPAAPLAARTPATELRSYVTPRRMAIIAGASR